MITFKSFLTEESTFDLEKFKTECDFFLKQSKGKILWHGTPSGPAEFAIWDWKPRAKSRNSPNDLHTRANEVLTKLFSAPTRNWMFVTGRKGDAVLYANRKTRTCFMIVPIGKFEWVCSTDENLRDMTTWHMTVGFEIANSTDGSLTSEERDTLATNYVINKMRHMKWEHNTNLSKCIASHNEIMLKCSKFYIINEHSPAFRQVMDYLQLKKE